MVSVWPTIERFLTEHGAAVLVTLADSQGSSPREAGARMIVRSDGAFSGTIGGGALEWMALADAQSLLAHADAPPLRRFERALGPDLGQCCGGRVTVMLERFTSGDMDMIAPLAEAERRGPFVTRARTADGRLIREPVPDNEAPGSTARYTRDTDDRIIEWFGEATTLFYLFGAGHVGRSLVLALAPLSFAVTWTDPRPDAFPGHVPGNVTCRQDTDPVRVLDAAPAGSFIAVMTHSHALDLDLVTAALTADRFPYVGLIGSATKRARFFNAMRKIGIAHETIERLVCPIGLTAITDKSPAAIAAGIAAQALIERERLANPAERSDRGTPRHAGRHHA